MNNSTNLEIVISAKDQASSQIQAVSNNIGNMKGTIEGVTAVASAAFAGLSAALVLCIDKAEKHQEAEAQLGAVLQSTGGEAGVSATMANNLANSLQQVTTYSNDTILGAENLLLTFTKIGKDIFPQATQTVLDMSTALGQDLKSSAIQLGKALQDPVLGVTALRRVGVAFSKDQVAVIKSLVDTGQSAKAQAMILQELGKEFGGSAMAQATTFAGVMDIVKNNIDDTEKSIGTVFLPVLKELAEVIDSVVLEVNSWTEAHPQLIAFIASAAIAVTGLIAGTGALILVVGTLDTALLALGIEIFALTGPIGWVLGALTAVGIAAGLLGSKIASQSESYISLNDISGKLTTTSNSLSDAIGASGKKAEETAKKLTDLKNQLTDLIDASNKKQADSTKSIAELFVAQQQNVSTITVDIDTKTKEYQKALSDKQSADSTNQMELDIIALKTKLSKEQGALTANQNVLNGMDAAYAEAERRAGETEFQRKLEDILAQQKADKAASDKKIAAKKDEISALIGEERRYTSVVVEENNKKITSYNSVTAAGLAASMAGMGGGNDSISRSLPSMMQSPFLSVVGGHAQGGNVMSGSTYMVGERGPELFTPTGGGTITPNGKSGGGSSFVVNIMGGTYLSKDVALEIGNSIINSLKLQARI